MDETNNILPNQHTNYLLELLIAKLDRMYNDFNQFKEQYVLEQGSREKPDSVQKELIIYYTTEEAMKILHVCRNTLLNYRKSGELPFIRLGKKILYRKEDIDNLKLLLEKNR